MHGKVRLWAVRFGFNTKQYDAPLDHKQPGYNTRETESSRATLSSNGRSLNTRGTTGNGAGG